MHPKFRKKYELNDYCERSNMKRGRLNVAENASTISPQFQKAIYEAYFIEDIFENAINREKPPEVRDVSENKRKFTGPGFLQNLYSNLGKIEK